MSTKNSRKRAMRRLMEEVGEDGALGIEVDLMKPTQDPKERQMRHPPTRSDEPITEAEIGRVRSGLFSGRSSEEAAFELDEIISKWREPTDSEVDQAVGAMYELMDGQRQFSAEQRQRYIQMASERGASIAGNAPQMGDLRPVLQEPMLVYEQDDLGEAERLRSERLGELEKDGFPEEMLSNHMFMVDPSGGLYQYTDTHRSVTTINRSLIPMRFVSQHPLFPSTEPIINMMLRLGAHPLLWRKMEKSAHVCLVFQLMEKHEEEEPPDSDDDEQPRGVPLTAEEVRRHQQRTLLTDQQKNTFLLDNLRINVLVRVHNHTDPWEKFLPERYCGHLSVFNDREYNFMAKRAALRRNRDLVPRDRTEGLAFSYVAFFYSYF